MEMIEKEALVRKMLRTQGRATERLGSPFMARLMPLLAERMTRGDVVSDTLLGWKGDPAVTADNPALRLAGGLHALVLTGKDSDLAAVYPPNEATDDAIWDHVSRALVDHADHLLAWLGNAPQTNEVRRAAALIPAFHLVASATGRPLALWELGCSGGLNLRSDSFVLQAGTNLYPGHAKGPQLAPEWSGDAPEPTTVRVVERRGVDLNPLNPNDPEDQLRLRAYLWPDQAHRRALTEAAIAMAAQSPARVDQGDAVDWLAKNLSRRVDQATTVIFHTVAWQYLPREAQDAGHRLIAQAGRAAQDHTPLAHIGMEANDDPHGAALTLRLWPGEVEVLLARVDWHGRWVDWVGPTRL